MKAWTAAMAVLVLLLTGCVEEGGATEHILQMYENIEKCSMEAVVRCEYETESREYTLQCEYESGGKSRVMILKPAALQNISIVFDGEGSSVIYEDLILDAPKVGDSGLSPANVLPCLVDAMKSGWLLEQNAEEVDGEPLQRMTFETEKEGGKQYWTVLVDARTGIPLAAELAEDSRLFFTIEFTKFTIDDIITLSEP